MKAIILFLFLSFLFLFGLKAQSPHCAFDTGTSTADYLSFQEDVKGLMSVESIEERGLVYVPVVFHVVYSTEDQNISEERILDQLDLLNTCFRAGNSGLQNLYGSFSDFIGHPNIQFCLAEQDASGQATSGILRKETEQFDIGRSEDLFDSDKGGSSAWDTDRYINIWIAPTQSFIGKATFPNEGPPEQQGIIIDPYYVGGIEWPGPVLNYDRGKSLVHEMGHYFGLEHLWGSDIDDCSIDDGIDDTPACSATYVNTCFLQGESCGSLDMSSNFMMYSYDDCLLFFTREQAIFMNTALYNYRPGLLENSLSCRPLGPPVESDLELNIVLQDNQVLMVEPRGLTQGDEWPSFYLFDCTGRLLIQRDIELNTISPFSVMEFPSGVYFLNLSFGEHRISKKIFLP